MSKDDVQRRQRRSRPPPPLSRVPCRQEPRPEAPALGTVTPRRLRSRRSGLPASSDGIGCRTPRARFATGKTRVTRREHNHSTNERTNATHAPSDSHHASEIAPFNPRGPRPVGPKVPSRIRFPRAADVCVQGGIEAAETCHNDTARCLGCGPVLGDALPAQQGHSPWCLGAGGKFTANTQSRCQRARPTTALRLGRPS